MTPLRTIPKYKPHLVIWTCVTSRRTVNTKAPPASASETVPVGILEASTAPVTSTTARAVAAIPRRIAMTASPPEFQPEKLAPIPRPSTENLNPYHGRNESTKKSNPAISSVRFGPCAPLSFCPISPQSGGFDPPLGGGGGGCVTGDLLWLG